ncbi:MAG: class I SAM-dependent methyltransferase [Chitinophagaceae bacterium]|nr:class I SAM-dependent methyltransferase [Chitinophagaceae bacterium]
MKNSIQNQLGQTDIYLIDQILKGRYTPADIILDAGCGNGRNMHWFLHNGYHIIGIDISEVAIAQLKSNYPGLPEDKAAVCALNHMPFADNHFDHIICSAVLHFANSVADFNCMFTEMIRVLKPGGSLFLRMTTDIGIENKVELIADGVYAIPDGSTRFLLTRHLLADCVHQHNLSFMEPLKTVNVDDVRCMCTLLLQKH